MALDGFEESARIVEAHMEGQSAEVLALLERIAEAIRGRAIDD